MSSWLGEGGAVAAHVTRIEACQFLSRRGSLAPERHGENLAGLLEALWTKACDPPPEEGTAQRVKVVEARHTALRHPVVWSQQQLAAHSPDRPCTCNHHYCSDPVRHRVPGQHEHGPVPTGGVCPPDLAPHHAGVPAQVPGSSASASSSSLSGSRS